MCRCVLTFICQTTKLLSAVGKWVSRYGRRVYNAIVDAVIFNAMFVHGDCIFDAIFVDDDGMGLRADNAKRFYTA